MPVPAPWFHDPPAKIASKIIYKLFPNWFVSSSPDMRLFLSFKPKERKTIFLDFPKMWRQSFGQCRKKIRPSTKSHEAAIFFRQRRQRRSSDWSEREVLKGFQNGFFAEMGLSEWNWLAADWSRVPVSNSFLNHLFPNSLFLISASQMALLEF